MAFRFYDVESRSCGLNQNGGRAVVHAHDGSKRAVLAMDASRLSSVCRLYEMRCEMRDASPAKGRSWNTRRGWEERKLCFVSGGGQKMDSRKAAMVGLGRYG